MARLLLLLLTVLPLACGLDYADADLWVYRERGAAADKPADVFFLAPTMCLRTVPNMDVQHPLDRALFRKAVEDEYGIYTDKARFYAPYYRQKSFVQYLNPAAQEVAYADARAAFRYYMEHDNGGRPFILAGYSQGAEQMLRLMKEELADEALARRMVAAYLIGWCVTAESIRDYPQLRPAQGERDTGVFISWNSEAAGVKHSMLVPRGTVAHCINPLNWRTDATPAPAALNEGGCLRTFGSMGTPQRGFCGAVINPQRGTLNPQFAEGVRAPRSNPFFGSGIYHAHEPFLYRANHRRNVVQRIEAYLQAGENR